MSDMPQTYPACSGGYPPPPVSIAWMYDDGSDDIRDLGDRIAALTLAQMVQLGLYLRERHGLNVVGIKLL